MATMTRTSSKGRGWLCIWGLVLPLPTLVLASTIAAFVGTSFHNAGVGGTAGLALFGAVAAKAWRDGPRFFSVFLGGIACTIGAAIGLLIYALEHMGPLG